MNNKLIRKKPNRLLTYRRNYFDTGGEKKKNNATMEAMTNFGIQAAGLIGGGLIGGGYNTGVGDTVSGLSSLAATAIPGIGGALTSAGLGLAGGLFNRMFGSKLNKENIAKVESNINKLNSFQSNASDFDSLAQNWANAATGMNFKNDYIGSDGWFSNTATNKANELRAEVEAGKNWVLSSLTNNAMNILNLLMSDLWRNSAAYGGPLFFADGGTLDKEHEDRGLLNPYSTESLVDAVHSTSNSNKRNNNYKEGGIYDVTEEEIKILKELGYEFKYM